MSSVNILGISGSLRRESTNTILLRSLADALHPPFRLELHALDQVPLYDQDLDTDVAPPRVVALRDAIRSAHGLVVMSPEYNHGMPGMLKNAIDWASRPYGRACLIDKPVLTITTSSGPLGGVRAQAQLRETFVATQSLIVGRRQIVIPYVLDRIRDGRLVHDETLGLLVRAVDELATAGGANQTSRRRRENVDDGRIGSPPAAWRR